MLWRRDEKRSRSGSGARMNDDGSTRMLKKPDLRINPEFIDVLPNNEKPELKPLIERIVKVIAANWGGPADYINKSCGLLVEPLSETGFIDGLAEAMVLLARSPELRKTLGEGGKARVQQDSLDWEAKTSKVLSVLAEVVEGKKAVTA